MPQDRGNETPDQRTARHLSEVLFDHPMPSANLTNKFVVGEGYFLKPVTARLDPRAVKAADFDSRIALKGNLPLREDHQAYLDAFRAELVSKGIIAAEQAEQVQVIVDQKQEGQTFFATIGARGGTHVDAALAIPVEVVNKGAVTDWALKSRAFTQMRTVIGAVDGLLEKADMAAAVREMFRRDPEGFRDSMLALMLENKVARASITDVGEDIRKAAELGTHRPPAKPGGFADNFGDKPRGPNEV